MALSTTPTVAQSAQRHERTDNARTTTPSPAASPRRCLPQTLTIPTAVKHRSPKLSLAHRGASYHLPEHSLGAYRLALELGADYLEIDVVATSDGQLVALHGIDLNVTTNVAQVFPDREQWFSPTLNRTGFWTYNFTAQEIQALKLHQDVSNWGDRSSLYDNLFTVPLLEDILALLVQWNTVDLPLVRPLSVGPSNRTFTQSINQTSHPTPLQLIQSGLYVELKDTVLLMQDTGIDLVELFYQHLQKYFDQYWERILTCFEDIRHDEYVVPALVIQSFDVHALESFHSRWDTAYAGVKSEPTYVLLVERPDCWDAERFWFKFGDNWRSFVAALGVEKACLLANKEGGVGVITKAKQFDTPLHIWTERPELVAVDSRFRDSVEEILYLYCSLGVAGIFSDSVSAAVVAARIGCQDEQPTPSGQDPSSASPPAEDSPATSTNHTGNNNNLCYDSPQEANAYAGFAFFVMGVFIAAIISAWWHRKRRRRYAGTRAVPTHDLDLEMT